MIILGNLIMYGTQSCQMYHQLGLTQKKMTMVNKEWSGMGKQKNRCIARIHDQEGKAIEERKKEIM
jgi:hypothetical protein